jgi:glycerophosphoryl diester phosphodiesterase
MMIRNFNLSLVCLLCLTQQSMSQPNFKFFEPVLPPRQHQVMLHRGMHQAAPENSRHAVLGCADQLIEWVEVDVRLTKDGQHVIVHDASIDRTSNGHGAVRELTLAKLKELDCGSWFAARFRDERILTLPELLALAKGRVNLYLDCKEVDSERLVREVKDAMMANQIVVYGGLELLSQIRSLGGDQIARMAKFRPQQMSIDEFVQQYDTAAVEIDADQVTAELCRQFRMRGVRVQAKVLGEQFDRPDVWRAMFAAGVDWLQTDDALGVRFADARFRFRSFPVQIAFHRGASRHAPENTLAAIEKAVSVGADLVEFDIRTSSDGQHFLMHDRAITRTTSGTGEVREVSSETLSGLDAGSWFGQPFASQKVPSLSASLAALGKFTHAYLDAKDISPQALIAAIDAHDMWQRHVVYQSLDYCRKLCELAPHVRTLPPLRGMQDLDLTLAARPYGVDVNWNALSPELISRCHAAGVRVFSDALGEHEKVEDYRQAIDWGIDVIQTDYPLRVLRAIELVVEESLDRLSSTSPLLIAHRGGVVSEQLIENNVAAISEAIRRGYHMLEVDLRESRDGHIIVHHDADFHRFYNDPRRVSNLTWDEIRKLQSPTGERPLEFAEFAERCRGHIQLMLDVKEAERGQEFFQEIQSVLQANGLLNSALIIGTKQSKLAFLGKARVAVNYASLIRAAEAGEPVSKRYFLFEHGEDLTEQMVTRTRQLGVTVVPSINVFHYDGDGNHWLLARHDIRRLRALGITHFQIDSVYEDFVVNAPLTARDDVCLNQVQCIGTHNSYHIAMPPAMLLLIGKVNQQLAESLDYSHLPLTEQLEVLGMRQLELDVFADPEGGKYANPQAPLLAKVAGWDPGADSALRAASEMTTPGLKVLHVQDIDYRSQTPTLRTALTEILRWSEKHPWHAPVLVLIEAKEESIGPEFNKPLSFDMQALEAIDAEIREIFPPDKVITPDAVRGPYATLREAIANRGWPKLEESRGKVIFALDNEGGIRDAYLSGHETLQGRQLFVSVEPTHPAAAFRKLNDPIADFDQIRDAVRRGLLVRTRADADTKEARRHETLRRERALASGAQFISTDFPTPDRRWSSYKVQLPGNIVVRANPVNCAPEVGARDLDK